MITLFTIRKREKGTVYYIARKVQSNMKTAIGNDGILCNLIQMNQINIFFMVLRILPNSAAFAQKFHLIL